MTEREGFYLKKGEALDITEWKELYLTEWEWFFLTKEKLLDLKEEERLYLTEKKG